MRIALFIVITSLLLSAEGIKMVSSKKVNCTSFTTDNLGNVFQTKGNTIEKYLPDGTLQNQYSSKLFGNIDIVDTQNPLQILLYHEDVSQVILLDNTLSLQVTIPLEHFGLELTQTVCSSTNSGFWAFNPLSIELIKISNASEVVVESGNLSQIIGLELNPNYITEHSNRVYLNDPKNGIFVFDIFGTYLKTIPIKGLSSFQATETDLYYLEKGSIFGFNFKTLDITSITLPTLGIEHFRVEKNSIYTLKQNMLSKFIID